MMTFSLIIGILLTFWGGFDLARYIQNQDPAQDRAKMFYCVMTTLLGVTNVLLAAGVFK